MDSFFKKAEEAVQEQGGSEAVLKEAQGLVSGGGEQQTESKPTTDQSSTGGEKPTTTPTTGGDTAGKTDYKEVYGSAQTLVQGIQDKLSGQSDVSNAKLAGAADDILKAAKNSGIDKDNQYGQYFDKAESYLAKYKEGDTGTGTGTTTESKGTTTDAPKESEPAPTTTKE